MPEALKKVNDFNDEEKAAIAARAKRSELSRVAKDFGTTWQVVNAIKKAAEKPKSKVKVKAKAKAKPAAKTKTPARKTAKKASTKSIAKPSSNERRLEILKRAGEIGVTQAAAEAGVSKWTVFQWRKVMKKAGYEVPPVPKGRSPKKTAAKTAAPKSTAKVSAAKTKAAPASPKVSAKPAAQKASSSYSSIEFENEMLKQKVAALTQQVERLRAALKELA